MLALMQSRWLSGAKAPSELFGLKAELLAAGWRPIEAMKFLEYHFQGFYCGKPSWDTPDAAANYAGGESWTHNFSQMEVVWDEKSGCRGGIGGGIKAIANDKYINF